MASGERAARYAVSHVQKYLAERVKTHSVPGKNAWYYLADNEMRNLGKMMDNLETITDPIEEVLELMVKHQLAVVADKKLDLAQLIGRLQRQLIKHKKQIKTYCEQRDFLHNAHEDLMGQVERIYGV